MKAKRKMPAHIVLPNGMWRFIKSGAKTAVTKKAKATTKRKRKSTGGLTMAKRGRKSRGGGSSKGLMKAIFPVSGIIAGALIGAGAATLQEKVLPQYHPLQGTAAGFVVGGIPGAVGAFARNALAGNNGGTSAGSW